MKFKVDDLGSAGGGTAQVTIRRDGQALPPVSIPVGQEQTLQLPLEHGGQTVFEITAEERERLDGGVLAVMGKAGFDGKRFVSEVRRAMSGRLVAV